VIGVSKTVVTMAASTHKADRSPVTLSSRTKFLLLAAAVLAAALKIYCAATTYGSSDVTAFCRFGAIIHNAGLGQMYRLDSYFNHTPFTGHFVAWAYALSAYLTPGAPHIVPRSFPILLRLPSIAADVIALIFLVKFHRATGKPPVWALALFALSPVAFMVSGFHGNVDSVMICLVVIAVYYCVQERVMLSALFLALACSVKIIPLLLVPAFALFWLSRGKKSGAIFCAVFGGTCLAAWSEALIKAPGFFLQNVLGYNSFAGGWGITYLAGVGARLLGIQSHPVFLECVVSSITALKGATIFCVVALAWFRRKAVGLEFARTIAYCWVCFAILAPGFVPYYLVWITPFLLFHSAAWYAAVTIASSIYLFAYYNIMAHGMPWNVGDPAVRPLWASWGTIPWLVLVGFGLTVLIQNRGRGKPAAGVAEPMP
jgi:uncharacterized membrane protein